MKYLIALLFVLAACENQKANPPCPVIVLADTAPGQFTHTYGPFNKNGEECFAYERYFRGNCTHIKGDRFVPACDGVIPQCEEKVLRRMTMCSSGKHWVENFETIY